MRMLAHIATHAHPQVEEGAYGVVFRVRDRVSGEVMALKRLKMEREKEGFPITALREINTLLKCKHENIVSVQARTSLSRLHYPHQLRVSHTDTHTCACEASYRYARR